MNAHDLSFFILDDEISIKDGPVTIVVDHETIMEIVEIDVWESLTKFEKQFAAWYQNQIIVLGMEPAPSFIIDSALLEPYNQEELCKVILGLMVAPDGEDPGFS